MPRRRRNRRRSLPPHPLLPLLPVDIWLHIVQLLDPPDHLIGEDDTLSLASTNKFFRGIALPVLFNTINLTSPDCAVAEARPYLRDVIKRIQDITSSPHILKVVRRLTLFSWCIRPVDDDEDDDLDGYITDDPSFDPVRLRADLREASQLINEGYREIVALISNLPRLYHLECHNCALVPEFFSHIFRVPSLQSLEINGYSMITNDSINFQVTAPSLHLFQYCPERWYQPCPTDAVKLFVPLIGQFTAFSIPFNLLPYILADNNMPTSLPNLRKLSLFNLDIEREDDHSNLECLHSLLSLAPNLHELRILGNIHSKRPFILADNAIRNLKILIVPSYIANGIVSGRALEKLHIFTFESRNFPKDYTVISQDIKHVIYNGVLNDPKEELSRLAQVFPNATTVEITGMKGCRQTFKELSDAVLSVLPELRHLKRCMVFSAEGCPRDINHPLSPCPVGRAGDLKYRSHPTLEDLQIVSFYRWIWIPEDGWHPVNSGYHGAHDLYKLTFFK